MGIFTYLSSWRSTPNWWDSIYVNGTVLAFYNEYAGYPRGQLEEVERYLSPFLRNLNGALEPHGISCTVEGTGSAYEEVHELHPDKTLELDIEFVMNGTGANCTSINGAPCCFMLRPPEGQRCPHLPAKFFDWQARISAKQVIDVFEKACRSLREPNATFETHGPAVTMKKKKKNGNPWFAVDLVPAIQIPDGGTFVPKQRSGVQKKPIRHAWRQSFSLDERNQYSPDWQCPTVKPCLRILKALCDRRKQLRKLQSYVLKNIVFFELDENPGIFRKDIDVGSAVRGLLHRLEGYLADGFVPQFFNKRVNLIADLPENDLLAMRDYVHQLCENEDAFLQAFSRNCKA